MPGQTTNDTIIGFKKISTWGTAVAVTSTNAFKLRASQLSISGAFGEISSSDTGFAKKIEDIARGVFSGQITITVNSSYNQPWSALLAAVMGTEGAASAEITASQGDYSHTIDVSDSISNASMLAFTVAFTTEDSTGAKLIELPSVKFFSASGTHTLNDKGSFTFQGFFDKIITSSWTTSYANLTGLSATSPYELMTVGGTNHYFRMNANSGGSLSGSNDLVITELNWSITRPTITRYGLRGANTQYTYEPLDNDKIDGRVSVKLLEINASSFDFIEIWKNKTAQKGEFFVDGTAIGTGVNRSMKLQFPRLVPDSPIPAGYDVPNNNSLQSPVAAFRMTKASSAPTGMSGVTDLMRAILIDQRSTKWTA